MQKSRRDFRKVMGAPEEVRDRTSCNGHTHKVTFPAEPGCPIHLALQTAMEDAFSEPDGAGHVSKTDLLRRVEIAPDTFLDMRQAADIQWDFILRAITNNTGASIMGLTGSFFKIGKSGISEADRIANLWAEGSHGVAVKEAGRHLVSLKNGKANSDRVKGFAPIMARNGALSIARLTVLRDSADRFVAGYEKDAVKAIETGLVEALPYAPKRLLEQRG